MPELPELEVVTEVLQRRIVGQTLTAVELIQPGGGIIARDLTFTNFAQALTSKVIQQIQRRSKFLVFTLSDSLYLAINEKLTGRLQLCPPTEKRKPKTWIIFTLSGGSELRYFDQKTMGQFYLTHDLAQVPDYAALGPEPFDIDLDTFRQRLKRHNGEIKNVLINGAFIAGIGNAYADEILWTAHLNPYRKRSQLTPEETEALYNAIQSCLHESIEKVRAEMGENIHLKPRDFMAVHMKSGEPCPRCGTRISLVGANQRITNYCLKCQPGGLFKGM
jgi:formamidopyrimidine-DNA glycosylase